MTVFFGFFIIYIQKTLFFAISALPSTSQSPESYSERGSIDIIFMVTLTSSVLTFIL